MSRPAEPVSVRSESKADALLDLFLSDRGLLSIDVVDGNKRLGTVTRETFFELLSVAPEAVSGNRTVAKILPLR